MQVKCICNKGVTNVLTIGKIYDVVELVEDCVKLQNDKGYTFDYRKERFENVPAEPSGKVMTLVKGINLYGVTLGKNYNVVQVDDVYRLFDDHGREITMPLSWFIDPSRRETHRVLWANPNEPSFGCGKQIGGTHYKKNDPIQFAIDNYPPEQLEGFFRINIDKYVARYPDKNGLEDLYKARDYLNRLIELKEGGK